MGIFVEKRKYELEVFELWTLPAQTTSCLIVWMCLNSCQQSLSLTLSKVSNISKICFSWVTGLRSNQSIRRRIKSWTLTLRSSRSTRQLWNLDCTFFIARSRISGIWCSVEEEKCNCVLEYGHLKSEYNSFETEDESFSLENLQNFPLKCTSSTQIPIQFT